MNPRKNLAAGYGISRIQNKEFRSQEKKGWILAPGIVRPNVDLLV